MKKLNLLKHFDEIEKYLDGQMGQEEKTAFEARLDSDKELAEAYRQHKEVYRAVSDRDAVLFRQRLQRIIDEEDSEGKRSSRLISVTWWYWLAASILLLLGLSVLLIRLPALSDLRKNLAANHIHDGKSLNAENYQVPGLYYDFQELKVREGAFTLNQPPDSLVARQGKRVHFSWDTSVKDHIALELFNYRGELERTILLTTSRHLRLRLNMQEGVYLYRFRAGAETLHVGVLFVSG